MRTVLLTPSSLRSRPTMEDRSATRDSCYFHGCRKDANCNCEICLASINATQNLMPTSFQQSSLAKLSASKPMSERTPISFNPSILSTPRSDVQKIPSSPTLKSTAKSSPFEKLKKKRKRNRVIGFNFWRFLVGFSLIFAADSGFAWIISELFRPILSPNDVKRVAEESWVMQELNMRLDLRLDFLEKKLKDAVHGKVANCSSVDSLWELDQDGLLLRSHCTMYKSASEEVSVWGWPLQTTGLLTTGLSSRSLTILTGRITEWSEGKVGFSVRKANNSWVQPRWRTSAVQLDPKTWVLEYRSSSILESSRLLWAVIEVLKFRMSRIVEEMKQQFWVLPAFLRHYNDNAENISRCPT